MFRVALVTLAMAATLPAMAQDRGGLSTRDPYTVLNDIEANAGCPLSSTSVTVGLNKATAVGSLAQQQLTTARGAAPTGCRPLVSTQVVAGVNLALGPASSAGQTISATGPAGVLATTTYTRGYNIGYGPMSTATQRLFNQTTR